MTEPSPDLEAAVCLSLVASRTVVVCHRLGFLS